MMQKILALLFAVTLLSCNGFKSIKSVFKDLSPYEQYVESLKKAALLEASMTKEWLLAGSRVFEDSIFVDVPFSESGFFSASTPEARSYRFNVKDGQVLTINGAVKTERNTKVFLDLFVREDESWERIASADSAFSITYEFNSSEDCVVRLQPELLANAYYAISISVTPVLINPVFGATNKSIGSFFGAPRDNGKRSHEGVDIFAPKGTPVVAPTDGYITRVGTNTLGGKVVWMKDPKRQHSYYFAHLDSQMVKPGMKVYQGHVLGLVGNTGNAKRTPPHLHFGIYQYGSKDPLHYIRKVETAIASLPIDTGFHHQALKVKAKRIVLHAGPSSGLSSKRFLTKDSYVKVIAQTHEWYRVALPDETEGFLLKKEVTPLEGGVVSRIDSAKVLLSAVHPHAIPVAILAKDTSVEVLAHFEGYRFVTTDNGKAGWLYN